MSRFRFQGTTGLFFCLALAGATYVIHRYALEAIAAHTASTIVVPLRAVLSGEVAARGPALAALLALGLGWPLVRWAGRAVAAAASALALWNPAAVRALAEATVALSAKQGVVAVVGLIWPLAGAAAAAAALRNLRRYGCYEAPAIAFVLALWLAVAALQGGFR